jgi:hypothetical protein
MHALSVPSPDGLKFTMPQCWWYQVMGCCRCACKCDFLYWCHSAAENLSVACWSLQLLKHTLIGDYFSLFSLLSWFWRNKSRLMRSRCCLCARASLISLVGNGLVKVPLSSLGNVSVKTPISLPGNGSVKIPLSLLGNGSVKILLSLLGNSSVERIPW